MCGAQDVNDKDKDKEDDDVNKEHLCDEARWQKGGLLLNAHVTLKNICKRINTITNCIHSCMHVMHNIHCRFICNVYFVRTLFLLSNTKSHKIRISQQKCKLFVSEYDNYMNTVALQKPEPKTILYTIAFIYNQCIHTHALNPAPKA